MAWQQWVILMPVYINNILEKIEGKNMSESVYPEANFERGNCKDDKYHMSSIFTDKILAEGGFIDGIDGPVHVVGEDGSRRKRIRDEILAAYVTETVRTDTGEILDDYIEIKGLGYLYDCAALETALYSALYLVRSVIEIKDNIPDQFYTRPSEAKDIYKEAGKYAEGILGDYTMTPMGKHILWFAVVVGTAEQTALNDEDFNPIPFSYDRWSHYLTRFPEIDEMPDYMKISYIQSCSSASICVLKLATKWKNSTRQEKISQIRELMEWLYVRFYTPFWPGESYSEVYGYDENGTWIAFPDVEGKKIRTTVCYDRFGDVRLAKWIDGTDYCWSEIPGTDDMKSFNYDQLSQDLTMFEEKRRCFMPINAWDYSILGEERHWRKISYEKKYGKSVGARLIVSGILRKKYNTIQYLVSNQLKVFKKSFEVLITDVIKTLPEILVLGYDTHDDEVIGDAEYVIFTVDIRYPWLYWSKENHEKIKNLIERFNRKYQDQRMKITLAGLEINPKTWLDMGFPEEHTSMFPFWACGGSHNERCSVNRCILAKDCKIHQRFLFWTLNEHEYLWEHEVNKVKRMVWENVPFDDIENNTFLKPRDIQNMEKWKEWALAHRRIHWEDSCAPLDFSFAYGCEKRIK